MVSQFVINIGKIFLSAKILFYIEDETKSKATKKTHKNEMHLTYILYQIIHHTDIQVFVIHLVGKNFFKLT